MSLLPKCLCGVQSASVKTHLNIPVLECSCGIVRQDVRMTTSELAKWYQTRYHRGVYRHSKEHDLDTAKKRLDAYGIAVRAKVLDVGCGNGAFVEAARARGINAWGQDVSITSESDYVYVGALQDVAFPTDDFDVVTVHDVLEHLVDPRVLLKEIRRILRRPGKLVVDFPRFHDEAGVHHWKPIEHLWMLDEYQLIKIIESCGFRVTRASYPIPSKVVIEAEPLPERRPQILTPPGIGDSYWVLTKLAGFLRAKGLGLPDVWVQDSGGPRRTEPYLRNIPMVNAAGYRHVPDNIETLRVLDNAYWEPKGPTVQENFAGCDYFMAYNGVLRAGRSLEEVDPEYGCEWRPKMHVSKEALKMQDRMVGPGRYILTYWAEAGMYREWIREFSAVQIADTLRKLSKEFDARIVFMGSPWDRGQIGKEIADMDESFQNLIGATSFDQMLGTIMGATAVVGFPAGNTMLAASLNIPTVLLWNSYFDRRFWTNSCPPDANYTALDTKNLTPEAVLRAVRDRVDA